jgi:DNA-binding MarR family transcriptional regulator
MTGVEIAVLCLLARQDEALYASELIHKSGGILTRPATYVLLKRMCAQGLIEKHFDNATDRYNNERPFYVITAEGKLKILDFLRKLNLFFA